ncbi:helix-turn-helix domain-containing protein [Alkalicoccus saliphilus]|uniref:XRE family transcriptional regulator n=1 Tax=Alkalicoccus saliphilus TaxID=200989 RepID=A0A2T4U1X9_9BACI|nr:XRE family transcriptional regulator [Alkalicoccus saliphilus]
MIKFNLHSLLKQHNYSQHEFSEISKVRPNTINDMCNNKTKRIELETLNKIMKGLQIITKKEVSIEDLIRYEDEMK